MIDGMKQMTHWHTKSFNASPIGDGYEVEVNEFDYTDDNGICYDKNGVTVRHWRRSHNMDGASGYRLDWNGLSFVWTGDGRPDTNTIKYAQGVDVFVTELQPDIGTIMEQKSGIPAAIYNSTIDLVHTDHYATGYMIKQVNPRIGMVTHMAFDRDLVSESLAGIRQHWDGLFCFGAPDGVVVNVTKDAVWTRDWAVSDSANMKGTRSFSPSELRAMLGGDEIPTTFRVPTPRYSKHDLLSPEVLGDRDPGRGLHAGGCAAAHDRGLQGGLRRPHDDGRPDLGADRRAAGRQGGGRRHARRPHAHGRRPAARSPGSSGRSCRTPPRPSARGPRSRRSRRWSVPRPGGRMPSATGRRRPCRAPSRP